MCVPVSAHHATSRCRSEGGLLRSFPRCVDIGPQTAQIWADRLSKASTQIIVEAFGEVDAGTGTQYTTSPPHRRQSMLMLRVARVGVHTSPLGVQIQQGRRVRWLLVGASDEIALPLVGI
eukprot:gene10400-biopygen5864